MADKELPPEIWVCEMVMEDGRRTGYGDWSTRPKSEGSYTRTDLVAPVADCAYEEMYEGGPWVCTSCGVELSFESGDVPSTRLYHFCFGCGRRIAEFGEYVEEETNG